MNPIANAVRAAAFLTLLVASVASGTGCIMIPAGELLKGPSLQEVVLREGAGFFSKEKVAIVDVSGTVTDRESPLPLNTTNTLSEIKARLDRATKDPEVKAVVLRISSPGGEATACDILHQEVVRLREERKVPVVACVLDQAASGGYYIACGAERIIAHPTSIIGSIGVILHGYDLSELLEKVGVDVHPVKSSDMKDLNSLYRAPTEEEREVLEKLVRDTYDRFVEVVVAGRPDLSREEVLRLADGRVLSGVDAESAGLIDEVGYLEEAIDEAARRAGIDSPTIVSYTRKSPSGANIYTGWGGPPPGLSGRSFAAELSLRWQPGVFPSTRLYYLWAP